MRRCPLVFGAETFIQVTNGLQTVKYMMNCTVLILPDISGLPDTGVFFLQVLEVNQSTIILKE